MTGYPEIDAILDRAAQYRHRVYTATGSLPERFIVTEREYHLLQLYFGGPDFVPTGVPDDAIQVFGMKAWLPERFDWYRDNRYMEHFKMSDICRRAIQVYDPLPCLPTQLERCRTELPPIAQREVACPCGEVIWDMSTCTVPFMFFGESGRRTWSGFVQWVYNTAQALSDQNDDPLPPLDDLDEGCQCKSCDLHFNTFVKYMAHMRQHGQG